MAKVLKDVLYSGDYTLPGGRKVSFPPDKVKHLRKRMRDMLEAGLQIPLSWEHQDDAKPMTPAEVLANKAKFNLGHAESAAGDDGPLACQFDVPNEEDAKRLPSAKFVSPEIVTDWIDGNGKLWPGPSITHVAVTARPIQHNQKSFEPVRFSFIRLSLEDKTVAEEKPIEGEDGAGKEKYLKEVIEALKGDGYHLPDDTSMENFVDRLHTACLTKTGGKAPEEKPAEEPTEVAQSPIMMSLQSVQKENAALKAQNATLSKLAVEAKKDSLIGRIERLSSTGRITKPVKDKLVKEASTVRLSLSDNGELAGNELATKVSALEENPANCVWPTRLSAHQEPEEVEPPDGRPTKAEVLSVANRLSGGLASESRISEFMKNGK